MTRSYYAEYRAVLPGQFLIGAVRESRTSRFQRRADAEARLEGAIEVNGGISRCVGEIHASSLWPEILVHCEGRPPTAVGARCSGCGQTITVQIAKKAKAVP